MGVLKAKEKIVDLEVNGIPVDIHMKLDDNGAAFFVEGLDDNDDELPPELATSPLPNINDQEPTWDEAQREAANRSLIKEFEATEEDEVDDASADSNLDMYPLTKSKLNKNKRKKKTRSKHSRSGSKASLKEILIDNQAAAEISAASNKTPVNEETPTKPEPESGSLLLSRIPDSFDVEEQNLEEEMQEKNKSLPIEIEKRLQYFSEPELSPGTSPMGSRPGSPVMSDTEYEIRDRSSSARNSLPGSKKDSNASEQSWEWGQFPQNTPQHTSEDKKVKKSNQTVDDTAAQNKSGWGISSYFFGGKKESSNKAQEAQGVYLDDLKDVDEEMLKIYVGASRTRNNTEMQDDDTESGNGPSLPMSPHSVEGAIGFHHSDNESFDPPKVDVSFCGGLNEGPPGELSQALFEQSKVSFDDFVIRIEEKPDLLQDPSLVIKIADHYYTWEKAAPIIMSHVLYGRALPQDLLEKLKGSPKSKDLAEGGRKSSWWPFGSRKEKEEASNPKNDSEPIVEMEEGSIEKSSLETEVKVTEAENNPSRKRRTETSSSSETESEPGLEKFKKTLRLSNEAIKCLSLKKGANEIQFSVTTAFQGTTRCMCHVYLWSYDDKIVISDIDGTITKSDVLGHVLPIIGRDWAQSGVASLFTKIVNNGYHIVYLSARAIGQASITKDYLASVKQGEVNLPDGPIFLNPTSLVNAFHREVIEKKPEAFKIACLRDIKHLFPEDRNPFYAGYGNRVNDVWAYQAVGIPMSRIFTINPKGELRHELTNAFQTSYGSMTAIVDHVFPPIDGHEPQMALDYSSFTFWRDPLPQIIDETKEESAEESESKVDLNKEQAEKSDNNTSSSSSSPTTVVETINDDLKASNNPK